MDFNCSSPDEDIFIQCMDFNCSSIYVLDKRDIYLKFTANIFDTDNDKSYIEMTFFFSLTAVAIK